MLSNSERNQIKEYIGKVCQEIYKNALENIENGMKDKDVVNQVSIMTVNRMVPESKMVLSSVYSMLADITLSEDLFQDPLNESKFRGMNLESELRGKFNFTVPDKIAYKESEEQIDLWIKGGAIAVGGAMSITLKSLIPIGIAALLVGLMAISIRGQGTAEDKTVEMLIKKYLEKVGESIMQWVADIEDYYEERVNALKESLTKK